MNNGDGTFTSTGQQFDVGVGHGLLLAGDFNNDGKLDLMASDANGFSILLGNGDGTFQNGIPTASPAGGSTLYALADFNHDGKLDIAVVSSPSTCYVFLGKGDGTFEGPITSPAAGTGSLSAADINGDGKPDLVLANGNYVAGRCAGDDVSDAPAVYRHQRGIWQPRGCGLQPGRSFGRYDRKRVRRTDHSFQRRYRQIDDANLVSDSETHKNSLAAGDFNGDRKPDLCGVSS